MKINVRPVIFLVPARDIDHAMTIVLGARTDLFRWEESLFGFWPSKALIRFVLEWFFRIPFRSIFFTQSFKVHITHGIFLIEYSFLQIIILHVILPEHFCSFRSLDVLLEQTPVKCIQANISPCCGFDLVLSVPS